MARVPLKEAREVSPGALLRARVPFALVGRVGRVHRAAVFPYALVQRWEGRKTVTLPHGTIKTTAGQPKIEIESEDRFIEWARVNNPDLLKIKTDIDKTAIKALITEEGVVISTQGEIIPEVKVVPAETSVKFVTE